MINDQITASLNHMDEVFGDTSVVFYTAAAEGDFAPSYVSRNIGRVLGIRPEACVDSAAFWREHVHAEDIGRVLQEFSGLSATGCCIQKFRLRDDQDGYRWITNEVALKHDANGIPAYLAGCLCDVGETRTCMAECVRNEQTQRAKEHFYRSVLDSLPQHLFWKDRNSVFRGCNLGGAHALNLAQASEIIGKTDYDFYSNHDEADYLRIKDEQVMNSGLAFYHAEKHNQESGVWLDVSKVPLHDEKGEVYGLLISHEDITARKSMENALAESEEKLRATIENSMDAVVQIDTEGIITGWNSQAEGIFGWSRVEAVGRAVHETIIPHKQREAHVRGMKHFLHTGEGPILRKRMEVMGMHRDGREFLIELAVIPIKMRGKYEFSAFIRDITERKRIEQELQKAMAAAAAANRTKSAFLANMSHEIRTPMNAIIGLSHLCMQTKLTAKQKDYLQKVYGSAKALLGMLNELLDFSKIEAGKIELEQVRFELEDVMDNLSTIISTKTDEKGLEFLFETSLDVPPHLIGDPLRLGQVLINLAGNAVKFTEKGVVLVRTEIEEETEDDVALRFTIQDSGIGMTQEQIGKLFQAFTQADSATTRKYGGTGLGLTISKQLVELMNGKIWVESAPGQGSKFIFIVRLAKAADRRAVERNPLHVELHGMRVLAVDDSEACRRILQSYLESFAFHVTMASNGIEALQAVEQADRDGAPYRLVILSWKMPEMDGIEAAKKIHAMAGLSKMPKILLFSSFGQSEMLRHLEESVADGILTKPFQQSGLLNAIMEAFGFAAVAWKRNAAPDLFHSDLVTKISGAYLLLAEDNEINQQVAQELLAKAGVTVAIVGNGKEAIDRLWEEKFDGVLMDMQMPVMDGVTAAREIRKNPRLADLPIIAMTANVMASDRKLCLAAGMNDHINKPLDPDQMIATLVKWITPAHPTGHALKPTQNIAVAPKREELPDLPGVQVDEGVRRMGGNVSSYCAILERFRDGRQNAIAEIRSAIAANDWETAERLAHTLKGLLGTLGADELKDKTAELDTAIRDKESSRIDSLLPAIDAELTRLFSAIDCVLQLRAADKKAGEEVADATGPVNMEELTSLIHQAKLKLEQFDSSVEDAVARIHLMVSGDTAMKNALIPIERHVSSYQYEQAMVELTAYAKSMGVLCEV